MHFIQIRHQGKTYRYQIEQLGTVRNRERWRVITGNGELVLNNNRPTLLRLRLKQWEPKWEVESRKVILNKYFMELIIEAIEKHVEASG